MKPLCLQDLKNLDFITVHEREDKSQIADLSVLDACEHDGAFYLLASDAGQDFQVSDDDEDDEDDEDEEDENLAYIFRVCEKHEAEFVITEDGSDLCLFVTTDFSSEDFSAVAAVFSRSEDYDISIEESDDE